MKKKIIYISGAEVFDVNDVRAAFEEVRNTLKLDSDTILFGVPVDNAESVGNVSDVADDVVPVAAPVVELDDDYDAETESDADEFEMVDEEDVVDNDDVNQEIVETPADSENDAPVVPILSVLATKEEIPEIASVEVESEVPVAEIEEPVAKEEPIEIEADEAEIADMINDEMPADFQEKTLEELLESMTPLHEEVAKPQKKQNKKIEPVDSGTTETLDEIDATLENLASEFAENQDKVTTPKKSSERGKIGKLKNILPFKKTKREDPGLMGDLFGWAGIAANDDDFTIPGFFKQKM